MELPEVEVMRRDLEKDVVGRKVAAAEVRPSKNAMRIIRRHGRRKEFTDRLVGRKIGKVERRGKYVLLFLDNGDVLVVHFGMSGQFLRGNKRVTLPPHTHVGVTVARLPGWRERTTRRGPLPAGPSGRRLHARAGPTRVRAGRR